MIFFPSGTSFAFPASLSWALLVVIKNPDDTSFESEDTGLGFGPSPPLRPWVTSQRASRLPWAVPASQGSQRAARGPASQLTGPRRETTPCWVPGQESTISGGPLRRRGCGIFPL